MKKSTEKILTTHVGSLPRPDGLNALMRQKDAGQPYDRAALMKAVREAVTEVVRKQVDVGIDVIDDGEQSKVGFIAYLNERLAGFEPLPVPGKDKLWAREFAAFPEYYEDMGAGRTQGASGTASMTGAVSMTHLACTGPVAYKGHNQLRDDLENLKSALRGLQPSEVFVPAASPASVEGWQYNRYYKSAEEYLFAVADAMREEYSMIIEAGFLVQVDDPWIMMSYTIDPKATIEDCRKWAMPRIEALNYALRSIPAEKVRHHTCYGINMGPRTTDLEMKEMFDLVLKINAGAYSFEAANPRHEHEWRLWETLELPEGKVILPGVVTHTSVLVEHPELVAERLVRYAKLVGRENVMGSTDCGFASNPRSKPEVHPRIVWAKMKSLVEGARLASKQIWGRS